MATEKPPEAMGLPKGQEGEEDGGDAEADVYGCLVIGGRGGHD